MWWKEPFTGHRKSILPISNAPTVLHGNSLPSSDVHNNQKSSSTRRVRQPAEERRCLVTESRRTVHPSHTTFSTANPYTETPLHLQTIVKRDTIKTSLWSVYSGDLPPRPLPFGFGPVALRVAVVDSRPTRWRACPRKTCRLLRLWLPCAALGFPVSCVQGGNGWIQCSASTYHGDPDALNP